jgi:hypothetical protein
VVVSPDTTRSGASDAAALLGGAALFHLKILDHHEEGIIRMALRKWDGAVCGNHKIARLTWQAPSHAAAPQTIVDAQ